MPPSLTLTSWRALLRDMYSLEMFSELLCDRFEFIGAFLGAETRAERKRLTGIMDLK